MLEKPILDPCCGSRIFWFDKNNPYTIFGDCRRLETTLCDGRALRVQPDMLLDVRALPFSDEQFRLVVFDPPHLRYAGEASWLRAKYGVLPDDWGEFLRIAFAECMRVLLPYGTLVCKWNTEQISMQDFLAAIGYMPLLGDQRGKTRWMVFMKIPNDASNRG